MTGRSCFKLTFAVTVVVGCLGGSRLAAQGLTDFNGYITTENWLALGPFTHAGIACTGDASNLLGNHTAPTELRCQYPEEGDPVDYDPDEATTTGYLGPMDAGQPYWRLLQGQTPGSCLIDLDIDAGGGDQMLTLLLTYVEYLGDTATTIEICANSDDDQQIFWNDLGVMNIAACRAPGDCSGGVCDNTVTVDVEPDTTYRILHVIFEDGGGWGGSLRLLDEGVPIVDGDHPDWVFHGIELTGGDTPPCVPQTLEGIQLDPKDVTLTVGAFAQLSVMGVVDTGFPLNLTTAASGTVYTIDPTGIVTIDDDGFLTTEAAGETTVTATNGEFSDTTTFTVEDALPFCDNEIITDPGFEDPFFEDGGFGPATFWTDEWRYITGDPPDPTWIGQGEGYSGAWNPGADDGFPRGEAFEGENVGFSESGGDWEGGLSQLLNAELEADTQYVLSAWVGNSFYNGGATNDWRLELLVALDPLGHPFDQTMDVLLASATGPSPASGLFNQVHLVYNSAEGDGPGFVGEQLKLRLVSTPPELGVVNGEGEVEFDQVSLCTSIVEPEGPIFVRGDCNDDGNVDISDATCTLNWLFLGGATPGCLAVVDTNGEDDINITDATFLLNFLFLGGPPLPQPYPDCGTSDRPSDEALGCLTQPESCQ